MMQNKSQYTTPVLNEICLTGMTAILEASFAESSIQNFDFYDNAEE